MQNPQLISFRSAVMADLAARRQIPATHFSQPTPRLAGSSSNKLQCLKAPILPSILVPTPVFKSTTNLAPETVLLGGCLEAEFDTIDLLPQDLLSADVLREGSQSRDAELKAVD
jgi:hypothetical protein